jgi:hypothetical protein
MKLREFAGYLLATSGLGLGVFAWAALIAWGWGVLGAVLFLVGWRLLSKEFSGSQPDGDCWTRSDLIGDDIDILD